MTQVKYRTGTIKRNYSLKRKVTFCVQGVISPLLSNLYLDEVDRMLEKAKDATRQGKYTYIEYARFADDLVILIDVIRRAKLTP